MKTRSLLALLTLVLPSLAHAQGTEQLWRNNCMNCHGDRGQGGGAGTPTLLTDELFRGPDPIAADRLFFDIIKDGKPDHGMARFGDTLTDPQIWGLVNYIRELQARDRRQRVGSPARENPREVRTQRHTYGVERVIASGLRVPWSVEFLPDGRMLVADRSGELRVHSTGRAGGELSPPVQGVPAVRAEGQGGLMDIALHPDIATNGWIYLSFSDPATPGGRGPSMTKIVRGKLSAADARGRYTWTDARTIFEAKREHYVPGGLHFGCRIVFQKPDKPDAKGRHYVYWAIGDRGRSDHAQDLSRPNGKVHRLWDDGQTPDDNPYVGRPDAYPSIWSFGHRNPQGLVFDLEGNLWDTEHGPRGGDELNLVRKGANYGWPTVSFGIEYSGAPFKTPWPDLADARGHNGPLADIVMPADRWLPSIGACGLDVVRAGPEGEAFPDWRGDLLAGGLSGLNVDRIRVKDGKVVEHEEILHGLGRVRDVVTAPDGSIYVVLNDPDHVIRLAPKN